MTRSAGHKAVQAFCTVLPSAQLRLRRSALGPELRPSRAGSLDRGRRLGKGRAAGRVRAAGGGQGAGEVLAHGSSLRPPASVVMPQACLAAARTRMNQPSLGMNAHVSGSPGSAADGGRLALPAKHLLRDVGTGTAISCRAELLPFAGVRARTCRAGGKKAHEAREVRQQQAPIEYPAAGAGGEYTGKGAKYLLQDMEVPSRTCRDGDPPPFPGIRAQTCPASDKNAHESPELR